MVYCVDIWPEQDQFTELLSYNDENGFNWMIGRVENGFFLKYCGDSYFKDKAFDIEISDERTIFVKNTGIIWFQDADFDTFCNVRTLLNHGYTDDIWEAIEELIKERLLHDTTLLKSEVYKYE